MGRYDRSGRKVRKESVLLDEILRDEIKRELKNKYKVLNALCDEHNWSRSDYERIMKWLNRYNKRVEIGLLIDALATLGIDWLEVFERAYTKRKEELLE
ncbi:hypothetical protein [Desulfurobacterium sp.]